MEASPDRGRLVTTERAGFEPATDLSARTRFPVALLRPLGHLSWSRSGVPWPPFRAKVQSSRVARNRDWDAEEPMRPSVSCGDLYRWVGRRGQSRIRQDAVLPVRPVCSRGAVGI